MPPDLTGQSFTDLLREAFENAPVEEPITSLGDLNNNRIYVGDIGERGEMSPGNPYDANWDSVGVPGRFQIDNQGNIALRAQRIEPISFQRSDQARLADFMEEYINMRNEENPMIINYNTCQRDVNYNNIEDVIMFREKLDRIIIQHYQGGPH